MELTTKQFIMTNKIFDRFPDLYVRKFAIQCIQQATEDEIHDYLVQLTQALKYEMYHDSTLSNFLLRSALGSLRIAHKLYWWVAERILIELVLISR